MVSAREILFGRGTHQSTKPQVAIAGGISGATLESREITARIAIPLAISFYFVPSIFSKIPYTVYGYTQGTISRRALIAGAWPLLLFDDPEQYSFLFGLSKALGKPESKSRDQDEKSGVTAPSVSPKKSRGTKTFKSAPGVKPFWKNGIPKCKKGFRYDFKRKLCVKIK